MASTQSTSGRLSSEDWVDAAVEAFNEAGLDAIAVEPIAARIGATKGSFYWHFKNKAALVEAVLARWVDTTEQIIESLSSIPDPRTRLIKLFDIVYSHSEWARAETDLLARVNDPQVGAAVAQATRRRLEFMSDCLRETGLPDDAASDGAIQAYALWVGLLQLWTATPELVPSGDAADRFSGATRDLLTSMFPATTVHATTD